jgi:hypothetical protein
VKAKTAARPPAQEWNFKWTKGLTWQELLCCRDYEFARELLFLRQEVLEWRKGAQSDSFNDLLSYSWQIGPLGFIRSFFSFPEWPTSPIEAIGNAELSRRVLTPIKLQDRTLHLLQPRINEWDLDANTEELAAIIDPELAYLETPRETVVLSLPRNLTHEELRKCFAAYLKVRFPIGGKRGGTERPLSMWRGDLKSLGAYRLLKCMTALKAIDCAPLYVAESKWSEAKTRAKKVLKEYERAATAVIERRKRLGKPLRRHGLDGLPQRFH